MEKLVIGSVMTEFMTERKEKIKDLAKSTTIPKTTLYDWKNNKEPHQIFHLASLASHWNTTILYLCFRKGPKYRNNTSVGTGLEQIMKTLEDNEKKELKKTNEDKDKWKFQFKVTLEPMDED